MSIRRKITLLLGLLALVMLFQSVDRILYLTGSAKGFENLAERVDQTLEGIETLSIATRSIELLERRILETNSLEAMAGYRAELASILDETRTASERIRIDVEDKKRLLEQLDLLASNINGLIGRRAALLVIRSQKSEIRGRLEEQSRRLEAQILPFRIEVLSQLPRTPGEVDLASDVRFLFIITALHERLTDLVSADITEVTLEIESDILRLLSASATALSVEQRRVNETELGSVLWQILADLTGADGLASAGAELDEALSSEARVVASLNSNMTEIGGTLSKLVSESEREIGEIYARAAEEAQRKVISEIVLNAGMGLGILVAVWLVIARQISARLERLSRRVLRLAAGDLSPVETEQGADELTQMTQALDVFRQNARELRRSNEELANFAYIASHDLRSPLRAIRDLVDWTVEDHGPALPSAARDNLSLIRARTDRLSRLLQDLLDYARAGQGADDVVSTDIEMMVRDIDEMLGEPEALVLRHSGETRLVAPPTPLQTILLNLINNATKHRDSDKVHVTVSVERTSNGWDITVEDDGPGIPARYQRQVFELFRTLQSRDDVEASGMGLAMVEKLVRHLEWDIRLISNPDVKRGTAFILRIPDVDRAASDAKFGEGVAA